MAKEKWVQLSMMEVPEESRLHPIKHKLFEGMPIMPFTKEFLSRIDDVLWLPYGGYTIGVQNYSKTAKHAIEMGWITEEITKKTLSSPVEKRKVTITTAGQKFLESLEAL